MSRQLLDHLCPMLTFDSCRPQLHRCHRRQRSLEAPKRCPCSPNNDRTILQICTCVEMLNVMYYLLCNSTDTAG